MAPMWEALWLAMLRAAKQPPFKPRFSPSMPDWGHNTANELTKTVFSGIVRMAPKMDDSTETLAHKAGKLIGFFIRAVIFYWREAPAQFEKDGFNKLTKEQVEKLKEWAGLELLLPHASELAGRPITDKGELVKFYRRRILDFVMQQIRSNLHLINIILHRPVEEIFQCLSGIPKGFKAFLNTDGEFAIKGRRTEIYFLLLSYWPEIEEMRRSHPPKTRKYLLDWLEKEEGKPLVTDDKIFFAICDEISLDLTVPGHPFNVIDV